MILKAVTFWNEVYSQFPCLKVYNWMTSVSEGKADWFRNYSLTRVAVSANSKNSRGFYSQGVYDRNMEKLAEIEAKHQDLIQLMQW